MPVYIQDDKVLLIGLDVAVDTVCCCNNCPPITVSCDSISASKSKCGFRALHIIDCTFPFTDHGYSTTLNFVGCCSNFGNCAASGGASVDQNGYYLTRDFTFSGHTETGTECSGCGSLCDSGSGSFTYNDVTCIGSGDVFDCAPHGGTCCVSGTWDLSVEYTTAMLIANTVAAMPMYDGVYIDPCFALRDLSDDESTYTIQSFKPKFTIPDSRETNLNICYNEHFVPDDGGPPIDTPKMVTILAGLTEVVGAEVVYPDVNGVITITDVDCCKTGACCIDGACSIITQHECEDAGGDYFGDDTTCLGIDCTFGACCYSDVGCIFQTFLECFQSGGAFQGVDTTCSPNPCPGICCDCVSPITGCSETLEANCPGSWTQNTNEGCVHCMCSCCLPGTPFPCCEQVTVGQCISDGGTVVSLCGTCEDDTCSCVG